MTASLHAVTCPDSSQSSLASAIACTAGQADGYPSWSHPCPKPIRTPQANQDAPGQSGQAIQPPSPSTGSLGSSFTLRVLPLVLFIHSLLPLPPSLCSSLRSLYPAFGTLSKGQPPPGDQVHLLSLRRKPPGSSMTCSRDKGLRGGAPSERPSGRAGPARGVDSSPRPLHNAYQERKAEGRLLPGVNGRAHALLHPILGVSSRIQRDK